MIQYGRKVATYAWRQVAARYAPPKKEDRQQSQDDSLAALAVQVSILKDKVDPGRSEKFGQRALPKTEVSHAPESASQFGHINLTSLVNLRSSSCAPRSALHLSKEACDMHTLGMPMPYACTASLIKSLIARYNNGTLHERPPFTLVPESQRLSYTLANSTYYA